MHLNYHAMKTNAARFLTKLHISLNTWRWLVRLAPATLATGKEVPVPIWLNAVWTPKSICPWWCYHLCFIVCVGSCVPELYFQELSICCQNHCLLCHNLRSFRSYCLGLACESFVSQLCNRMFHLHRWNSAENIASLPSTQVLRLRGGPNLN